MTIDPIVPKRAEDTGGATMDGKHVSYADQQARQTEADKMFELLGDTGTRRYGGFFFEEYNQKWMHRERADIVEEMRRGDGYVKAALKAIKSPILATKWSIDTKGDPKDPKTKEIKEFAERTLFKMRGRTWNEFLKEALAYLDFGHYVFEIIWEKREDGYVHVADLAPRIPRSILYWRDDKGGLGITQIIQTDESNQALPRIPASKLLILTNDREGDDMTGISVLRAGYKHWKFREMLYKVQGIGAERFGAGIPLVKYKNVGDADKAKATEMAAAIHLNEQAYIAHPMDQFEVSILTPERQPHGDVIDKAIEHHGKALLTAVLASFLVQGDDGVGSLALVRDKSSFFLNTLNEYATYVCEQIDKQVIKKAVDLNFGPQEHYPFLAFSPIGDLDFKDLSDSLNALVTAGLINATDPRVISYVHKAFKIPEVTEDQLEMMEEQKLESDISQLEKGSAPAVPEAKPVLPEKKPAPDAKAAV